MSNITTGTTSEKNNIAADVQIPSQKGNIALIYVAVGIGVTLLLIAGISFFRGTSSVELADVVSNDVKTEILTEIALRNPKGLINLGITSETSNSQLSRQEEQGLIHLL